MRPVTFEHIIGQEDIKTRLNISIQSALTRNEALGHILFDGAPGLGKTTFARAIANEMSVNLQIANGANLRSIKAILPYIMRIQHRDIFFIDEIHRTTSIVQEFLYPIMEDLRCDLGQEDKMSIDIPAFTLIGATTNHGALSLPLTDRFPIKCHLQLYSDNELETLLKQNAQIVQLDLTRDAILTLAKSSRGTPRIANNRLLWIRDYALTHNIQTITTTVVQRALALEGISLNGMDSNDRKYIAALQQHKVLGLKSLAATTNLSEDTIIQVVEPFLMRLGRIKKTTKGRILSGN